MLKAATRAVLVLSALLFTQVVLAKEPTIHEIYQTAANGKLDEAQQMMDEVLKAHPNSGKAHFVKAELDSKQNDYAHAEQELKQAEQLQPGLPFAKQEAVQQLKARIADWHAKQVPHPAQVQTATPPATTATPAVATPSATNGFDLNSILWGAGLLMMIFFLLQMVRTQRLRQTFQQQAAHPGAAINTQPLAGVGPSANSGAGSGLLSTLATGAALGVGVVAGEALAHHFLDSDKSESDSRDDSQAGNDFTPIDETDDVATNNDLGGEDFGLTDTSGWENDDQVTVADTGSWDDGGNS